jgi:hypothetical protein
MRNGSTTERRDSNSVWARTHQLRKNAATTGTEVRSGNEEELLREDEAPRADGAARWWGLCYLPYKKHFPNVARHNLPLPQNRLAGDAYSAAV